MRCNLFSISLAVCLTASAFGAVRGKQAMYVGGTLSDIAEKTEGELDTSDPDSLVFTAKGRSFKIPNRGITSIEYGQKAGRRVGVVLAVSPLALFSKKRKHFISLSYADAAGTKQGVVFEVAKGLVGNVVTDLEKRSGKTVEFESDEAKKHFDKKAR